MLQIIVKHKWLSSFVIVLLSFLIVNLFLFPLFNSGDDVFLMYTLAGGYGEAPTNLLHYNHVWHPVLGWVIKSLFEVSPGINWYTIFLLVAQGAGCTALLYLLLTRFSVYIALLCYFIFFFFIEIRILLSLNFSSSAWVLATGGYVLLLETILNSKNKWNFFYALLFLLIAGLLRLHIVMAVSFLFFPCFLLFAFREFKKWGMALIGVIVILFLLNQQHQYYYKKHIRDWQQQENFRQSLFRYYNNPVDLDKAGNDVFVNDVEKELYAANFFYDTVMFSPARVEQIGIALANKRKHTIRENLPGLYWLFIELRVYILLLLVCIFLARQFGLLKILMRYWFPLSAFALVVYFVLGFFYKITFTVHMGFLLMMGVYLIWVFPVKYAEAKLFEPKKYFWSLLLLLPFAWICIRIIKNDKENREKHRRFECVTEEFRQNADKLFIATDDALPLGYFAIWDTPATFQIPNLIYKDRIITYTYRSTVSRFDISDIMQSIYNDSRVYLIGKEVPGLSNYYQQKINHVVNTSAELPKFKCLRVRKITDSTSYSFFRIVKESFSKESR